MDPTLAFILAGGAVAGFVQGLSGFAFGLVAMAVWAWALDPVLVGPLVVFGALIGQLLSIGSIRRSFELKRVAPFVVGGVIGVPLGVLLLRHIDPRLFKLGVGLLLAAWCPAMLLARDLPRIRLGGRLADGAVGMIGGVMGGLGGLTGPAPTLWATLRGWDRDHQRAVFQSFNLCMHVVTIGTYAASGTIPAKAWPFFPPLAVAMLVPTLAGARLYRHVSDTGFRRIVLGLLTLSGLVMVGTTITKLWG